MKTNSSMINVGDETESFTLAYEHQDANKPKINKRDFWQNPRKVRKKRRRDASPYYSLFGKRQKKQFFSDPKKKKKAKTDSTTTNNSRGGLSQNPTVNSIL